MLIAPAPKPPVARPQWPGKGAELSRGLQLLLICLIAVGAVASLVVARQRAAIERHNRTVELAADWQQVEQLSADSGVSLPVLLSQLKRAGVDGVVVSEDTIQSLRDAGDITVRHTAAADVHGATTITFVNSDPSLLNRVEAHLRVQYPSLKLSAGQTITDASKPLRTITLLGTIDEVKTVGVGLPDGDLKAIRTAGMDVVGRIGNFSAATPERMRWELAQVRAQGARVLIFSGEEVLGYRELVPETAAQMASLGLTYGSVEFAKQRGDDRLSRALNGKLLRVHSVTSAEAPRLDPSEMVERYVRAAEERNVRLCLVRLLPFATGRGIADQFAYIAEIERGLRRSGLDTGVAQPISQLTVPLALRAMPAVGATAAFFMLVYMSLPFSAAWAWALFILGLAQDLAMLMVAPEFTRKYLALKAAVVFPSIALLMAYMRERSGMWGGARRAVVGLLWMSGISLLGALFVVGLLSDRSFMVKAQQFAGIKLAHVLPLLGLGLVYALDVVNDGRSWRRLWDDLAERARRLVSNPVLVWQALLLLAAGAALLILVMRTGNESPVGVSPLELKFRAVLDRVLFVRPRTKEFLFGHPLLILALALSPILGKRLTLPLMLLGGVGQVSLVNTFCHIHTPLGVSVLRAANGLWTGIVVGVVATAILLPVARSLGSGRGSATPERADAATGSPE